MPIKKYKQFETERLKLKIFEALDAPFLFNLMNTPKWKRNIGDRNIQTIKDAKNYIAEKMTPQFEKIGFGNYVIIRKTDELCLGSIGLFDRPGLEGFDIGFALLPEHEKKGYAFEAANKLKHEAFGKFGIQTINAITNQDNFASQNLILKLGLEYVGLIKLPKERKEIKHYQVKKLND